MKILLAGINSKYVHTNLAVRKISAYLKTRGIDSQFCEYSGGEELCRVAGDLLRQNPDIIGFSCYIWNIDYTLKLAEFVKKARPYVKIVLGGPEAAYNCDELLDNCRFIDAVIIGEGETAFEQIAKNGITTRKIIGKNIDMSQTPFGYTEQDLNERGRIFYYESSRGCPFSCAYCLSSAEKGVKYKPLEQVFDDLRIFAEKNVRLVKFIDRTFNSDSNRSVKILEFLSTLNCDTQFHFEIEINLVTDAFVSALSRFKRGKLRIEAGLQSANEKTLAAVNRKTNLDVFQKNFCRIKNETEATFHLDLIAGLPHEDLISFKNSFNFAFNLNPDELQLGFLKVLPGTQIARDAEKFGIVSSSSAPYEVIKTADLSFDDIIVLKNVEAVLEMYHNSAAIPETERLLLEKFASPFDLYLGLGEYMSRRGLLITPHQRTKIFEFLWDFATENGFATKTFAKSLAEDYFLSCVGAPYPFWIEKPVSPLDKPKIHNMLADDSALSGMDNLLAAKPTERHKLARIERVFDSVWLISQKDKKIADVTPWLK